MKLIQEFVKIVQTLQGVVPESTRAVFARALSDLVTDMLNTEASQDVYKDWLSRERNRFFVHCYLTDPTRWVPEDLTMESTPLSEFCNKWMSVEQFKLRNEEEAEFRPITPEMNALRVTMVQELLGLAETKLDIPQWPGVDNDK